MFGVKKRKIQDLEQRLDAGEQQYRAAMATIEELRTLLARAGGGELVEIQAAVAQMRDDKAQLQASMEQQQAESARQIAAAEETLRSRRRDVSAADETIAARKREIAQLDMNLADTVIMVDAGLMGYAHPAQSSVALGEQLDNVRSQIKSMIRNKSAINADSGFTFNGSAAKGRKFVSDMSKMMLRAYNAEAENCILTVKAGNGDAARKRLERARDQVERLGTLINLRIDRRYHSLRLEELDLALRHQNAKKAEKEAEREERARLREERKAQQELAQRRAKLDKEREHYQNVLDSLLAKGRSDEADQIRARLDGIDEEIKKVDFRTANIRAGYVYVISNIGAFGDRMVKIGMTRRLDPMDRVRELGDASVPFGFDVHALFFSDDAVTLEADLHRRFADKRVNRINTRREFFYATPAEVRDALSEIAGNLLEFTEEPEAEQYRLSLQMAAEEKTGGTETPADPDRTGQESDEDPRN